MDKRTIALVILLAIVTIMWTPLMDWLGLYTPPERPAGVTTTDSAAYDVADSQVTQPVGQPEVSQQTPPSSPPPTTAPQLTEAPEPDSAAQMAPAETLFVETQTYVAALSTRGGALVSLKLKEYKYAWDDEGDNGQVEMIQAPERPEPQILFPASGLNLSELTYHASHSGRIDVSSAPQTVVYTYDAPGGGTVERRFTFYPDKHSFTMQTNISDRRALGIEGDYQALWETGIPATELNQADDYRSSFAMGMYNSGPIIFGEEGIIFGDDWENDHFSMSEVGDTYWVGKRSKYFTAIMIPGTRLGEKAFGYGTRELIVDPRGEKVHRKDIVAGMDLPLDVTQSSLTDSMTIYAGPMDWSEMKSHDVDLEEMFDIGTTPFVGWIIRIFAIPIIWLLPKMYSVVPNYGFVIILLGVLVKLVTYPLSKKTVKSMAAMKELQPQIEKLKEKHKKNPQAQQQAMMKLYKEAGVNPLASCLPMLAQMPLFFALFRVFNATILFRGAPFILWWDDLSRGALTWTDPYMILVLIMVVLMFLQQKVSMTDPRNKAMVYIMPLLFGFMFHSFSSGLVIYWSVFSAFSLVEQLIGNRQRARENLQVA